MRLRMSAALILALAGALSIGCSGITDPSQNTVESFAGTVPVGGARAHWFSASKTGEIAIKIADADAGVLPRSSAWNGSRARTIGHAATALCRSISSRVANTTAISGQIVSGPYCVIIYDPGNLTAADQLLHHRLPSLNTGVSALDAKIDDLYRLPLAEFTAARNALAKSLCQRRRQTDQGAGEADGGAVGREPGLLARARHLRPADEERREAARRANRGAGGARRRRPRRERVAPPRHQRGGRRSRAPRLGRPARSPAPTRSPAPSSRSRSPPAHRVSRDG